MRGEKRPEAVGSDIPIINTSLTPSHSRSLYGGDRLSPSRMVVSTTWGRSACAGRPIRSAGEVHVRRPPRYGQIQAVGRLGFLNAVGGSWLRDDADDLSRWSHPPALDSLGELDLEVGDCFFFVDCSREVAGFFSCFPSY